MLKIMASARRRPGMTHAEYCSYILDVHGALSRAKPLGLARYVQNHVYDSSFGSIASNDHLGHFHRDSVTELYFQTPADMQRTFSDQYVREVIAPDGRNFAELASNATVLTQETELVRPADSGAGTKILHFLHAAEGLESGAAQQAWGAAHKLALEAAPEFAAGLAGAIRSDVIPQANEGPDSHFGGTQESPVTLVVSLWIADAAVSDFRSYEQSIIANPAFDAGFSHFLLTREHCIFTA